MNTSEKNVPWSLRSDWFFRIIQQVNVKWNAQVPPIVALSNDAAKEIFGDSVTFTPLQALDRHGDVTVHERTDGTYDKTGLPDPLVLSLYFSLRDDRITQLIIIHNKARA